MVRSPQVCLVGGKGRRRFRKKYGVARFMSRDVPRPREGRMVNQMTELVAKWFCSSGIPFSAMRSGEWRILLAGDEIQVQRTITLTVGEPEVETVTVCITARAQGPQLFALPLLSLIRIYRLRPPSCSE